MDTETQLKMSFIVEVKVFDDHEQWKGFGFVADSAEDLLRGMLQSIEYEFDDTLSCDVEEEPTYVNYEVTVNFKNAAREVIDSVDAGAWVLAGYIPPGSSQHLDGGGLALWGDNCHGDWEVVRRDGQSHGMELVRDAIRDWMENIKLVFIDGETGNPLSDSDAGYGHSEWAELIEELPILDHLDDVPYPGVGEPEEEEIAEKCNDVVLKLDEYSLFSRGEMVATGTCLGTLCAVQYDLDGEVADVVVHASMGDIQRLIEQAGREIMDCSEKIARNHWASITRP